MLHSIVHPVYYLEMGQGTPGPVQIINALARNTMFLIKQLETIRSLRH